MSRWQDDESGRRWLDPEDDDSLAEDQLTRAGLYPRMDKPAVDIERFIEQYLGARLDQYADLGPQVLGQTEFFAGCPPLIRINKKLVERADEEQGTALFRARSTMAHEAAHVVKHSHLFIPSLSQLHLPNGGLGTSTGRLLRCSDVSFGLRGRYDRREVEANKGMAALLMPKELFSDIVEEAFESAHIPKASRHQKNPSVWSVVAQVSERLLVSKQAVSIRMEVLDLLVLPEQEQFAFLDPEEEEESF